jgi:hypothetical protein
MHAMLGRDEAGHIGHATGRTDGRAGESAREAGATVGEALQIGRMQAGATVRAGSPESMIVCHKEDDVGFEPVGGGDKGYSQRTGEQLPAVHSYDS